MDGTTPQPVDGILGQTVDSHFRVEMTERFRQHLEDDYVLPEGDDVWSTRFARNKYGVAPGNKHGSSTV